MSASRVRGWVKGGIVLVASVGAINVFAMGCRHGNCPTTPMASTPMVNVMPYGMPHTYGYGPPVSYGFRGPMMAHGAYGRSPQAANKDYVYAPPGETKPAKETPTIASSDGVSIR